MAAITIVTVLLNAGAVRRALSDEPAAPSASAGTPQGAAGPETSAAETVPPVVEGEPVPPPEAGDIQERAVPRKLPSSVTAAPPPSGMAPPPGYVGPTENITKVARAIVVRAKSLTMLIGVTESVILI